MHWDVQGTLALRLFFLTIGDFKTISPVVLASVGEAILVDPPLSVNLAPEGFGNEVVVTSLLAQDGIVRSSALFFALRRRYLAQPSALVPASRLGTLLAPLGA